MARPDSNALGASAKADAIRAYGIIAQTSDLAYAA